MKLFKMATDATDPGRVRRKQAPVAQPIAAQPSKDQEELNSILNRYDIRSSNIGSKSAFGKVYRGVLDGRAVAVKVEPRGTSSNESDNLKLLKYLRTQAPGDIKKHLPIVYEVNSGSHYNWYVIELLEKPHKDIAKDIELISYRLKDEHLPVPAKMREESEEEYLKRVNDYKDEVENNLIDDPSYVNGMQALVHININDPRLKDQSLIDQIYKRWLGMRKGTSAPQTTGAARLKGKRNMLAAQPAESQDSATEPGSAFYDKLERSFKSGIAFLPFAKSSDIEKGYISIEKVIEIIASRMEEQSPTQEEMEMFSRIKDSLPEAIFLITNTPFISKFSPDLEKSQYENIQTTDIDPDDYRASLRRALDWLSSHGLKWGDVHTGNIMIRPSTGDIVFIDYGLYKFMKPQ